MARVKAVFRTVISSPSVEIGLLEAQAVKPRTPMRSAPEYNRDCHANKR
jgi:hypothetical protein